MHLGAHQVISKADPRVGGIDQAARDAIRQAFIFAPRSRSNNAVEHRMKPTDAYRALPGNVSTDLWRHLDKNWRACFAALEAWKADPATFPGRPKLPRYTDQTKGRFVLLSESQAISRRALARGILAPAGLVIEVQSAQRRVQPARMVPRIGFAGVEMVAEQAEAAPSGHPARVAAVDLAGETLAALPATNVGVAPRLGNGRPLKSPNQFSHNRRAAFQEALGQEGTTTRLERLSTKRTRRRNHSLPAASKPISGLFVHEGLGTLVIGKTLRWKQAVELGRVNQPQFVQLPHARFLDLLTSKAERAGITVKGHEEAYTSKASLLDLDPLPVADSHREDKPVLSGKRGERGVYRAKNGRRMQADVNGAHHIGGKAFPNSFGQGRAAARAVRPVGLPISPVIPSRARERAAVL